MKRHLIRVFTFLRRPVLIVPVWMVLLLPFLAKGPIEHALEHYPIAAFDAYCKEPRSYGNWPSGPGKIEGPFNNYFALEVAEGQARFGLTYSLVPEPGDRRFTRVFIPAKYGSVLDSIHWSLDPEYIKISSWAFYGTLRRYEQSIQASRLEGHSIYDALNARLLDRGWPSCVLMEAMAGPVEDWILDKDYFSEYAAFLNPPRKIPN